MNTDFENKTYFLDDEFDFESIMHEFGSDEYSDVDYDSVGTVDFGLDYDDGILSSVLNSDEAPVAPPDVENDEYFHEEHGGDTVFDISDIEFETADDIEEEHFDDAAGEEYASDTDYPSPSEPKRPRVRPSPKSFREAIVNPLVGALAFIALKIQQSKVTISAAMTDDDDEETAELPADKAAKYYDSHIRGLRMRSRLAFIISLVLIYLSYGLPMTGKLGDVSVRGAVCTVLLLTVMLCGIDVICPGLIALVHKRPQANSLIAISSILCVVDGFIIACGMKTVGLPFAVVPSLTLSFALLGSSMNCRAQKAALNTVAVTKRPCTVCSETSVDGDGVTLHKDFIGTSGFVSRSEEAAPDEAMFGSMSLILIAAAPVLSIIAAVACGSLASFLHILSGIFVFAAPAAMLICYPLPAMLSALSLKKRGCAVAGWAGIYDMGMCRHLVVSDRDIFPVDCVKIARVRILSGATPSRVLSLASSIVTASGSELAPAFSAIMKSGDGKLLPVDNFEYHDGGGYIAMVDGVQVFCGSASFMHLMGVHIPEKYSFRDCIYVSENKVICGMFMMEYTAAPGVSDALGVLLRSEYHPIFALHDFNMSPRMISLKYGIATDGFDFPSFSSRCTFTSPNARPSAILSRDSLGTFVELADHAKSVFLRIRLSVLLTVLSSIVGVVMMFILALSGSMSVGIALTYTLVCLIPVLIAGLTVKV